MTIVFGGHSEEEMSSYKEKYYELCRLGRNEINIGI